MTYKSPFPFFGGKSVIAEEVWKRFGVVQNSIEPFCGYDGEHNELERVGWTRYQWKAHGGYGLQGNGKGRENRHREVVWFSPHCLAARQPALF